MKYLWLAWPAAALLFLCWWHCLYRDNRVMGPQQGHLVQHG
jgi:hypothetical protein